MTGSSGCWRGFGELLATDYSSAERMTFHQLVVDAYAAQHPGSGDLPQQLQSVGLHLMTLCLFLEHSVDPSLGAALHGRMVRRPTFRRLERSGPGELTWEHVPAAGPVETVRDAAYAWAAAVWVTYRGNMQPSEIGCESRASIALRLRGRLGRQVDAGVPAFFNRLFMAPKRHQRAIAAEEMP